MKRLASIIAVCAFAIVASGAGFATKLSVAYTAAPTAPNPNTTPPAASDIVDLPDYVFSRGSTRVPTVGPMYFLDHSDGFGGGLTCDVRIWFKDDTSGIWFAALQDTGVGPHEAFENVTIGPAIVFAQITNCAGGTIDGGNPLTLYLGPV